MKRGLIVFGFVFVLMISFVSAGFFSDLWNEITGKEDVLTSPGLSLNEKVCATNCLQKDCSIFKRDGLKKACLNSRKNKIKCRDECVEEDVSKVKVEKEIVKKKVVEVEEKKESKKVKQKEAPKKEEVEKKVVKKKIDKVVEVEDSFGEIVEVGKEDEKEIVIVEDNIMNVKKVERYGINFGSMFTLNYDFGSVVSFEEELEKSMNDLDYLGVSWVRLSLGWATIQAHKKDSQDSETIESGMGYAPYDRYIEELSEKNINFYINLDRPPHWACGYGEGVYTYDESYDGWQDKDDWACQRPLFNIEDWYDFVYETVNRYKEKTRYFAIGNEQDIDGFLSTANPEDYREMFLKPGAKAIKDACPECFVIGPEMAGNGVFSFNEPEFLESEQWLRTVFEMGGWESLDIISLHEYGKDVLIYYDKPKDVVNNINHLYSEVISDFGDKPIWITETGLPYKYNEIFAKDGSKQNQSKFYGMLINEVFKEDSHINKVFFFISHIPGEDDPYSIFNESHDYNYQGKIMHKPRSAAVKYKNIIAGNSYFLDQVNPEIFEVKPRENFFSRFWSRMTGRVVDMFN